jgi:hypothetical protein
VTASAVETAVERVEEEARVLAQVREALRSK